MATTKTPAKPAKTPPPWQMRAANRLVLARIALGKSQAALARGMLISPQRWNNYERGIRPIDIEFAARLCERYGLTMDYLYRGVMAGLPYDLAQRIEPLTVQPPNTRKN